MLYIAPEIGNAEQTLVQLFPVFVAPKFGDLVGVEVERLGVLLEGGMGDLLVGIHAQDQVVVIAHHRVSGHLAGVGRRVEGE